ncbi:MAG: DVUA0089 family protein [Pseudomonadota bacterium]
MIKRLIQTAAAACLIVAGSAQATVMTEGADTGQLIGTAFMVDSGTTQIDGRLANCCADLWGFTWNGGDLTIDTGGSNFDTQLFLFDSAGSGIVANDDGLGLGLNSRLSLNGLVAGLYYIGISGFDLDPMSASGFIFPNDFDGQVSATDAGALVDWERGFDARSRGRYSINFSAAVSVPAPATLALLGLGLIGVGAARRRKA